MIEAYNGGMKHYKNVELILEKEVKKSGHVGILYVPRKFIGRKVKIVIEKESE